PDRRAYGVNDYGVRHAKRLLVVFVSRQRGIDPPPPSGTLPLHKMKGWGRKKYICPTPPRPEDSWRLVSEVQARHAQLVEAHMVGELVAHRPDDVLAQQVG